MTLPELNNRIFEIIEHYSDGNITEFSRSLSGISRQRLDRLFKVDPRSNKYPTVSPDIISIHIKTNQFYKYSKLNNLFIND